MHVYLHIHIHICIYVYPYWRFDMEKKAEKVLHDTPPLCSNVPTQSFPCIQKVFTTPLCYHTGVAVLISATDIRYRHCGGGPSYCRTVLICLCVCMCVYVCVCRLKPTPVLILWDGPISNETAQVIYDMIYVG